MYGYVRPNRGELKVKDYERFRGVYCGLCHHLRRRYGILSRFLVNYDFTFLAMLLTEEREEAVERVRCPVHPLKCYECVTAGDGLDRAADETVILAWWKLRDGVSDEGWLKRMLYRLACGILKPAYKKAARLRPQFAETCRVQLERRDALEAARSRSIDEPADAFASILRAAGDGDAQGSRTARVRGELLYHLGRIIYILDAVDDLAEDEKSGGYNPLRYRFELQDGTLTEEDTRTLRTTLQHSHNSISAAYGLMDENVYADIISNVIYMGLPMVTEAVFSGQWHTLNRRKKEGSKL